MFSYKMTFPDFNGNELTEIFRFNLTTAEIAELDMRSAKGAGFRALIESCIETHDVETLIDNFKKLIEMSYGVKSEDGRKFVKNKEILEDFKSTNAYSKLFMRLATDAKFATTFITKVAPKEMQEGEGAKLTEEKVIEAASNFGMTNFDASDDEKTNTAPLVPMSTKTVAPAEVTLPVDEDVDMSDE